MTARAVIVHRIAGRARLRVPDRRGDAAYFADLAARLGSFEQVSCAEANPMTGSVTLRFDGSLDEVLRQAQVQGLLAVGGEPAASGRAASGARWMAPSALALPRMGAQVNLVSGRDINGMFMLGSMLLGVGLIQTFRGRWFPPAFSVFWCAKDAFNLAQERPDAAPGAGRHSLEPGAM